MSTTDYDVVIVGGGPVGLTLACELALTGVRTVVLEQRQTYEHVEPRALTLHRRTLEHLSMRGLLPAFEEAFDKLLHAGGITGTTAGHRPRPHFGCVSGFAAATDELSTLLVDRADVERILRERAVDLGVPLVGGSRCLSVVDNSNGVTVAVEKETGGEEFAARFVVGCDGARSTVRQQTGIAFTGSEPTVLTRMGLFSGGTETLPRGWERLENGWFMRMLDGRIAITEWDRHVEADTEPDIAEFEDAIERVTGQRVTLTGPVFLSRYSDRTRIASVYRCGHVLIAGDAAHVHFPAGGQGLNLGMQDAFNLGWKLAGYLCGTVPIEVLDSYERERRPIAAAVLRNTQAQLALMRPGEQVSALRETFASLIGLEGVADLLCGLVTGSRIAIPMPNGAHPLAGQFWTEVAAAMPDRSFTAAAFHGGGPVAFHDIGCQQFNHPGRMVSTETEGDLAFVFRPDGYLSWMGPVTA